MKLKNKGDTFCLEDIWDHHGLSEKTPEKFFKRYDLPFVKKGVFFKRHYASKDVCIYYADWLSQELGDSVREAFGLPTKSWMHQEAERASGRMNRGFRGNRTRGDDQG